LKLETKLFTTQRGATYSTKGIKKKNNNPRTKGKKKNISGYNFDFLSNHLESLCPRTISLLLTSSNSSLPLNERKDRVLYFYSFDPRLGDPTAARAIRVQVQHQQRVLCGGAG
jgi:hypothetical protein